MYYTYVLKSKKDGKYHHGYTANLTQRFEEHTKGRVDSTKHRRPLELVYYEACTKQDDALKREEYFKTHRGRQFLAHRLKSYFTGYTERPVGTTKPF
jgi:putative endonuclease